MSTLTKVDDIAERLSVQAIGALGAAAVGLPLVGTLAAQGVLDAALVAVAIAGGGAAGVLLKRRRDLEALPLELSRVAVRDEVDGVPVVKVRARLGRGRVARDPVVEAAWRGPGGDTALPIVLPARVVCGAFTVTIPDRGRATFGEGALAVRLTVRDRGRTWDAQRTFGTIAAGRFSPPVVRRGGRLAHDRDRWESVE